MKSYFFSLILVVGLHASAVPRTTERPIIIQNVNIMEWPENIKADTVLEIMLELIKADPQAQLLLDQSNEKLKNGGVQNLKDIFSYCTETRVSKNTQAVFSQGAAIIETRLTIPGIKKTPWTEKTLAEQKAAFSSKILTSPFFEFLVISEIPSICIYKDDKLFQAYNSVIHELTHFLYHDPTDTFDELLSDLPYTNHLENTVSKVGGELDAFTMGDSIEIRFLKKYGIRNYLTESHQYFDTDGKLINEEGLKKHLLKSYAKFYENNDTVSRFQKSKVDFVAYRLSTLKESIKPYVIHLENAALLQEVESEINKLEKLAAELQ